MTQEHRKLLLKDICARLPYGVKGIITYNGDKDIFTVEGIFNILFLSDTECCHIEDFKPYLFPLTSMTEEMLKELNANGFFKYRDDITNVSNIESKNGISKEIYTYIGIDNISFLIEYFHFHHIDYRGLIEKGLAIDATNLNIY